MPKPTKQLHVTMGKAYKPAKTSVQANSVTWATVQAILANGQPITKAQLQAQLATKHNHANFVGYAIRRGWLIHA